MKPNVPAKDQNHNDHDQTPPETLEAARDYLATGGDNAPAPDFEGLLGSGINPNQATPEPRVGHNLARDTFDERLYREIHDASDELRALPEHPSAFETIPELVEDLFNAFFKARAVLVPEKAVQPAQRRINRPYVERLLEDESTSLLRITTRADDMASALAALAATRAILDATQPDKPEPPPDHEPPPQPPPQPPPRRVIREALREARETVDKHQSALEAWGLQPGDLKSVPLGERLGLARALGTPRMAAFTALLGRLANLAKSRMATRLSTGVDEIHSVTTGGNLSRILPQELAQGLASRSPELRANFKRKLIEGTLLCHDVRSPEAVGKGPILALVDTSISMAGEPLDWATALAAALAQGPAAREGRSVRLIYFNTVITKEIELVPGKRDPRKLLDAATTGASGGTDYDVAVGRALDILEAEPAQRADDLVLVTDGQCQLSDTTRERFDKTHKIHGPRLYAVLCGPRADASDLARYASAIYHAEHDLASDAKAHEIADDLFGRI